MKLLARAVQIATAAHQDQRDKYGAPYLGHVTRVMNLGRTTEEKIVGVLHDVVEDTAWKLEDLKREGFPPQILEALACVTKLSDDEDYDAFTERIKTNPLAVRVKLNDLTDNLDVRRIPQLTEKDIPRLNKYLKAYRALLQVL